jgi:long-chain acyl-CoA synthetase
MEAPVATTTNYPTLPQRLLESVDRQHAPRAQRYKTGAAWENISADEMLRRIARLASAMAELGVKEGDRVAIFGPNCPEWHIADFAASGLGAVIVPIYFRESPERIEYIVGHAGVKIVFVAGEEQASRLAGIRNRLASVERVIVAGASAALARDAAHNAHDASKELQSERSDVPAAGRTLQYELLIAGAGDADVAAYRKRVVAVRSGQLASIIYTSGTTGEPKGVMLSHANLVSNEIGSFEGLKYGPDDVALSFLPLAHVYERVTDYGYLFRGISLAYVARPEDVSQALLEVRPTIVAAVPRFFEKLYATVIERGSQTTGFRRRLFDWAIVVARRSVPWRAYARSASPFLKIQWQLADRLVYRKFRAGVGGRIRQFISGGAPLAKELAEFFMAVGLEICQGYGLTETSPVVTVNMSGSNRIGTVGPPIRGVQVRIADDGEVFVRGSCVMMGYYKKPEETRAVISPDGWFATGDIGHLDSDGYLIITDRKKELIKTAGGKFVAPAPIENALKTSRYILNAAVVGDKRRFVAALIVPNLPAIQSRAREAGVTFTSPAALAANPWAHELIQAEIARLTANLAQYETIKRFALLDHDLTFDGGELTYTLKLKRRVIDQHYAEVIEKLYAEQPFEGAAPRP